MGAAFVMCPAATAPARASMVGGDQPKCAAAGRRHRASVTRPGTTSRPRSSGSHDAQAPDWRWPRAPHEPELAGGGGSRSVALDVLDGDRQPELRPTAHRGGEAAGFSPPRWRDVLTLRPGRARDTVDWRRKSWRIRDRTRARSRPVQHVSRPGSRRSDSPGRAGQHIVHRGQPIAVEPRAADATLRCHRRPLAVDQP